MLDFAAPISGKVSKEQGKFAALYMGKWDRFRQKLLSGQADTNIDFGDLCHFVEHGLGFIPHPENSGSHRVYGKADIAEIIDLQPRGHEAKPYQVRQVRKIIITYGL